MTHDIGCLQAIEAFYAYLDGELDDPESIADFEHHLGHCRSCFSRIEMEKALNERMRKTAKREGIGDVLADGPSTDLGELALGQVLQLALQLVVQTFSDDQLDGAAGDDAGAEQAAAEPAMPNGASIAGGVSYFRKKRSVTVCGD